MGRMARRRFSDEELDDLASSHVQYEVAMLVAQACEFHKRYPYGMPPPDRFKNPVVDDALLEATLVHLRLLDDFLRSTGGPRSVRAQEWVSQHDWQPRKDWLKPEIPKRISQQVAHLSQQRDAWFEWDIRDYAHRCCRELESFVGAKRTVGGLRPGNDCGEVLVKSGESSRRS